MKKIFLLGILFLMAAYGLYAAQDWNQYYFRFELINKAELQTITTIISIDDVKGNWVYAYANDWEWAEFQKLGFKTQLLPNPGDVEVLSSNSLADLREWDSYPTYSAYEAMMYQFASTYPNLCQIIEAGTTVNGRKILFAKISDNVSTPEAEPAVMYTATMHGDETTGYVLTLRLIDTLLSQYGSNPRITNLVNNLEIWINPLANPDGTYYQAGNPTNNVISNPRRANANGYDLNRNFPDPNGNQYPSSPRQVETTIMMNVANSRQFALSANYHGGAEVVNYPWDYTTTLHPDNSWYTTISRAYATSAQNNSPAGYMTYLNNGITNGAAWYVITGGRQDWMNYTGRGREVTLEISNTKHPAASLLNGFWNYNYDAMLGYLEHALYGVHGVVSDPWGNPLQATVTVLGHDTSLSTIKTSSTHGDFYRFLSPGTYTLLVNADGYPERSIPNVVVTANQKTELNIVLGELPHVQSISLQQGWNLISINVSLDSYAVQNVFAGIAGQVEHVKSVFTAYAPGKPAYFNTLSTIDPKRGYWVKMSAPATLNLQGAVLSPVSNQIPLQAGWNLVSYFPDEALAVTTALGSISSQLLEVRHQNSIWQRANTRNSLLQMQPGEGYWILVNQDCILLYP
ncbi:MAG: M14 family zinc carboxypeptidase [Candidatus Cloacimonadaceae bacterium]|nr:M14 family zinc carboxypeptidase [Candidatus Cloacimonadaceae bacterium]